MLRGLVCSGGRFEVAAKRKCRRELSPGSRWCAEPDSVRSVRPRRHNVGPTVTIEIGKRYAVDDPFAIVPGNLLKAVPLPRVEVDRSRLVHPPNNDVRPAVAIEIRHRERVGRPSRPRKLYGISEVAPAAIEDHVRGSFLFLNDCEVQLAITIKIGCHADPDPRRTLSHPGRLEEMALAIVPQNYALSTVAVRYEEVGRAVTIKIRRYNRCGGFRGQRLASRKATLAVVQAREARDWGGRSAD